MMKNNNRYFWLTVICLLVIMLASCGGGGETEVAANPTPSGDAAHGEELFNQTCVACHGEGGVGIEGLGKDMTTSAFIRDLSETEFVEFLKVGRPISDPANTTNVDMPPKGGNPALSDEDLLDIFAYIRTIQ